MDRADAVTPEPTSDLSDTDTDLGGRVSIYQPEQKGLTFPEIPQFNSVEEERTYRKQRLVAACRAFALHGFDYGFAGHISVRDPERTDLYWTCLLYTSDAADE